MFERADEFDLIHNSFDFLPLTYSGLVRTPVVTTIHGFSSERILPGLRALQRPRLLRGDQRRRPASALDYAATIHHGIEMDRFPLCTTPKDYLLYFGRIHPHKGTAEAIEVAARTGMPLVIAGIVQDEEYFERAVAPHLDGQRVTYVGPVGPQDRGRCWAAPARCCTSSASTSRSASASSRPWRAAPR